VYINKKQRSHLGTAAFLMLIYFALLPLPDLQSLLHRDISKTDHGLSFPILITSKKIDYLTYYLLLLKKDTKARD
jgi:hypothetical protein